ncbi:MAG: septum formation protein Maf [Candidatus Dadabacteria bacterium]|nr:MAG: septum formation protein Maf [Candidatus Dadabacteria bacterium]
MQLGADYNADRKFVLASGSPRRRELLKLIIPEFKVLPANICEDVSSLESSSPLDAVAYLSLKKAETVSRELQGAWVLGGDTIVVLDGKVVGKPQDPDEAIDMLERLQGRWHQVWSGVSLVNQDLKFSESLSVVTSVFIGEMERSEIRAYVESGEPLDKAGGYAIQGRGGVFVKEIRGSHSNVIGLPLRETYLLLKKVGIIGCRTDRDDLTGKRT